MKTKYWSYLIGVALVGLGFLIFRPVPIPDERNCLIAKGIVSLIYEGGTHDVVFKLKDQTTQFYVNRGSKRGLDINKLNNEIMDKEIVIKYPDYWTPLDAGNSIIHISKIEFNGTTLFTELD